MPSLARTARVRAYAKINLALKVLHRRADGYHELRSIFQTISLHDDIEVSFRPARETAIIVECPAEIPDNLAARAARAVIEETGRRGEVRIQLRKRIPMGGGLGGGSADAAAVLSVLPALLRTRVPPRAMLGLAIGLGSDVPFFLMGGTALGIGRGEELYPFPEPPACRGILVTPDLHVSTPAAFAMLDRTANPAGAAPFSTASWDLSRRSSLRDWSQVCENDFERAVFAQHPELEKLLKRMKRAGAAIARMTGSGSAIFGLFATREEAAQAGERFRDTKHVAFRLLDQNAYSRRFRL